MAPGNKADRGACSGVITVARRTVLQDAVRSYTVMVDDRPVGRLWDWCTGRYAVVPGRHTVRLRGPGSSNTFSSDVTVVVSAGQTVRLRTWSRLRRLPSTWKGFVTMVLNPTGMGYRYPPSFDLDPFGLWGGPRPWIVLGERPPAAGAMRFDAPHIDGAPSHVPSTREAAIIEEVDTARFTAEHHGYNAADVDHLLRSVANRARRGDPISAAHITGNEIRGARRGYSRRDVDDFLRRLLENL